MGCETVVNMVPLDFEEFLWANGITTPVLDMLHQSLDKETPVPEALHLRLNELLRQYALVGGCRKWWKPMSRPTTSTPSWKTAGHPPGL